MNAHGQSAAAAAAAAAEEQPQLWQHLDLLDTFPGLLDQSSDASLSMSTMNSSSARLETRIEIMEKILSEMMGRRQQEQLTAGQGSSQPPPLLHLLGMSGNGDDQLQQEQQIETQHGLIQIQQQLQNGQVGGVQQPTAPAAEADVVDAVVDANVGAADPAAAAAPEPNRRQPPPQFQLVDHPCLALASFLAFVALMVLLVGIGWYWSAEKAQLEKNLEVMKQGKNDLKENFAQKMADLEKQLAEEKARFADLEKRMAAEKAQELANLKKKKQASFLAFVALMVLLVGIGLVGFIYA